MTTRRSLLAPAALTLLAALVRLPTLGEQSFWLDEAYTVRLVRMSLGGMLHAIPRTESTPPLYYALAWVWVRIAGYSELGLRSLSAVAGILTVPVVYELGRRLAGRRAGVIAGLLVSFSPLMVWYSQEARAYALAGLLSALTLLALVSFLQGGGTRSLTAWALIAALGLATHYFVAFVVAGEAVWLLWRHRADRRVLGAVACVVAVLGALVPLALAQRGTGHADYIAQGSLATRLAQLPKQDLVGYASPDQLLSAVLAAVLVLAGGVAPLLARDRAVLRRAQMPLTVGAAAVLTPVVLAFAGIDFLNTRNLLPALPPLLVAVAIGCASPRTRRTGTICAAGLCAISIAVVALVDGNPRYQRDDWRGASRALGPPRAGRVIVVSQASGLIPLGVYQPRLRPLGARAVASELDVVAIPQQVLGSGIGAPPRPGPGFGVPAGFRLAATTYASTYTVLRYRAAAPVAITPSSLAASELGGPGTILVQERRGAPLRRPTRAGAGHSRPSP